MTSTHLSHAAMLQLIAEGMRSPAAGAMSPDQLQRVAGILDRIAVDLMVPEADGKDEIDPALGDDMTELRLHS